MESLGPYLGPYILREVEYAAIPLEFYQLELVKYIKTYIMSMRL